MLRLGRSTIFRLIKDGWLNTRQIGRRTLIPTFEIKAIPEGEPKPE